MKNLILLTLSAFLFFGASLNSYSQIQRNFSNELTKRQLFQEFNSENLEEPATPFTSLELFFPENKIQTTKGIVYRLDTVIVNNYDDLRYTYTYNDNGGNLTIKKEHESYDVWINSSMNTYTLDDNGNILTDLYEFWLNEEWNPSSKITYTYNENMQLQYTLYQYWNNNNSWLDGYKSTNTYDANGNLLIQLVEQWLNNEWVNLMKYSITLDNNGNATQVTKENWENNAWIYEWKESMLNDDNGNQLTYMLEKFENNEWVKYILKTNTYDENGNKLTYLHQEWENNTWKNSYRFTYTYNENEKIATDIREYWVNDAWELNYTYTYTYNSDGNLINILKEETINFGGTTTTYFYKQEYTYDANENITLYESLFWSNDAWIFDNSGYLSITGKRGCPDQDFIGYRVELSYIEMNVSGIEEENLLIHSNQQQCYPNPANTVITFTDLELNATIAIYDINGKQMLSKQIHQTDETIDISNLPSGFYSVHITEKQNIKFGKFVKQ